MIYDFAEPDVSLPRPGPLVPALDGLVRASKRARSEILHHKLGTVTWTGRLSSMGWRKFKRVLIPHIRHLRIEVKYRTEQRAFVPFAFPTWSSLAIGCVQETRDLLTWMHRRNSPHMKAKFPWRLERLTAVAIYQQPRLPGQPRKGQRVRFVEAGKDVFVSDCTIVKQDIKHWTEDREVKNCGIEIKVERRRATSRDKISKSLLYWYTRHV